MIESLALVLLRQRFPIELGSLKEAQRSHHVGLGKGEGILDRAVYVRFSSEMDDAIHLLVLHQFVEGIEVADIHLHKLIVGLVLDILEVSQITCIRQFVEVNDVILRVLVHKQAHYMASDKACATSNNDCSFHFYLIL